MDFPKDFVCECHARSTYQKHIPAPLFRKSIPLDSSTLTGQILLCGLGFYELFVNGTRITKGYLAPYISNPDHILYYDRYDLSAYLRPGENVIGIMLGDGFLNGKTRIWDFADNAFNSSPKLALSLRLGPKEYTARDFVCKAGPVLFNDLRSGVFYDRRLEAQGWLAPGYREDGSWHAPLEAACPKGYARLCGAEPIVVRRELRPVSVVPGSVNGFSEASAKASAMTGQALREGPVPKTGGYLYDFGENNAGIFRLKIKGFPGQRIDIQAGEFLTDGKLDYSNVMYTPDGYCQRDIYVVGSDREEIFEPPFTYHGFRYLYVHGITREQATEDLLTYLVMSSDLPRRGGFRCSDPIANLIFEMCLRSDSSNFYYFPTDCPQREKNGWTGDAQASAEHMILTVGAEKSWREWLHNIRAAQLESGKLPAMVPTGTWGYGHHCGPAWDKVLFELPFVVYRYRGETEIIEENADAMVRYLHYIEGRRDEKGILSVGLGDWLPVGKMVSCSEVPIGFSSTLMTYDICRKASEMLHVIGRHGDAAFAERFAGELRQALRREYLHPETLTVESNCQSAQALGLFYGVFEEEEKPRAFRVLMEQLHRDSDRYTCGFLGMRVLFHVLSAFGESEYAYRLITGTSYPCYGYFAARGYTTLPEQFLPGDLIVRRSLNHHFFGDVAQWYMRYPGGIHVESCNAVTVAPVFLSALDYAEAYHILPAGKVSVSWRRRGQAMEVSICCPRGIRGRIRLPAGFRFLNGPTGQVLGTENRFTVVPAG